MKEMNKILERLGYRQHKTCIFMNIQVNSNYTKINTNTIKALIKGTKQKLHYLDKTTAFQLNTTNK